MNAAPKVVRDQMVDKLMENRLVKLESDVGHIMDDVTDLKRDVHTVTDGIAALQKDLSTVVATIPHLATKAELQAMQTSMIRWFIGTTVAIAALVFGIARFVALPAAAPAMAGVSTISSDGMRASLPAEVLTGAE